MCVFNAVTMATECVRVRARVRVPGMRVCLVCACVCRRARVLMCFFVCEESRTTRHCYRANLRRG